MATNTADAEKTAQKTGLGLFTLVIVAFAGGFWLMLLLGIAHLNISTGIPALGYWTCVPLILLSRAVLANLRNTPAAQRVEIVGLPASAPTAVSRLAAAGDRLAARGN